MGGVKIQKVLALISNPLFREAVLSVPGMNAVLKYPIEGIEVKAQPLSSRLHCSSPAGEVANAWAEVRLNP